MLITQNQASRTEWQYLLMWPKNQKHVEVLTANLYQFAPHGILIPTHVSPLLQL